MIRSPHLFPALLACALTLACDRSPGRTDPPAQQPSSPPSTAASAPTSPKSAASGASSAAPSSSQPVAVEVPQRFDPFDFDPDLFEKKKAPRPGDWLARFPEKHRTFEYYVSGLPVRPTEKRTEIVLQPIGPFDPAQRRVLETLRELTSLFFGVPVRLANAIPLPSKGRRGKGRDEQHHAGVILDDVLTPRLPSTAICTLGITMGDLYPEPSWNFVFGLASLDKRVGVYSLARFFPAFTGAPDTEEARRTALRRSVQVLAHEAGHMFSLEHCVEYECIMNGSNSLDEMDRQVGMLCPTCLRKLQWNLRFDVRNRYERLRDFYRREGLEDLAHWMDRRLARIP